MAGGGGWVLLMPERTLQLVEPPIITPWGGIIWRSLGNTDAVENV